MKATRAGFRWRRRDVDQKVGRRLLHRYYLDDAVASRRSIGR